MSAIEWTCRRADKRARDFFTPFTESIVKRVRSRKWHRNRPIIFCWKKKNYWPPPPWHGSFQIRRFVPWLQVKKKKKSQHFIWFRPNCSVSTLLSCRYLWIDSIDSIEWTPSGQKRENPHGRQTNPFLLDENGHSHWLSRGFSSFRVKQQIIFFCRPKGTSSPNLAIGTDNERDSDRSAPPLVLRATFFLHRRNVEKEPQSKRVRIMS